MILKIIMKLQKAKWVIEFAANNKYVITWDLAHYDWEQDHRKCNNLNQIR